MRLDKITQGGCQYKDQALGALFFGSQGDKEGPGDKEYLEK